MITKYTLQAQVVEQAHKEYMQAVREHTDARRALDVAKRSPTDVDVGLAAANVCDRMRLKEARFLEHYTRAVRGLSELEEG